MPDPPPLLWEPSKPSHTICTIPDVSPLVSVAASGYIAVSLAVLLLNTVDLVVS